VKQGQKSIYSAIGNKVKLHTMACGMPSNSLLGVWRMKIKHCYSCRDGRLIKHGSM